MFRSTANVSFYCRESKKNRDGLAPIELEARPVWKPMHKQPVYASAPTYVNGVSEAVFKTGLCLPAGPCVKDDDVAFIVETIKNALG